MSETPNFFHPHQPAAIQMCESACESQPDLAQNTLPFGENPATGTQTAREARPAPEAPNPSAAAADAVDAPLATPAPRLCAHCRVDVEDAGKGSCPHCGRFLPGNVAALTHGARRAVLPPDRQSRRAELRAAICADLGSDLPTIVKEIAEDFVSACVLRDQLVEYLETVGVLTQRGTRRAAVDVYLAVSGRIERLSAQLGAFRTETKASPPSRKQSIPGLSDMPMSTLQMGIDLLDRLARGEALTERELGRLEVLDAAMQGEVRLSPDIDTGWGALKSTANVTENGSRPAEVSDT